MAPRRKMKSKPRRAGMGWLKQDGPNHFKYFDAGKNRWQRIEHDGHYADGGGLYLEVSGGLRNWSWYFRYKVTGHKWDKSIGLGSLNDVTLTHARTEAQRLRSLRATDKSIDPLEIRKAEKDAREKARQAEKDAKAKERTVRQVVAEWLEYRRKGLEPDWPAVTKARIKNYIYREKRYTEIDTTEKVEPLPGKKGIGDLPIKKLELPSGERTGPAVDIIEEILTQPATDKNNRDDEPGQLWYKLTRTASIMRGIIESFIEYALNNGYIDGRNAASMEDGAPLAGRLPAWKTFHEIKPHPALKRDKIAEFMAVLREYKDKRGWGRCPICDSPHLKEIEAIYYDSIVPAREAENKRAAALDQGPNLKGGFGFGYKNLCERFGLNPGTIWLHFKGHPQQKSKEYLERPLSTYALELIILTGPRKSQILEAEWEEIKFHEGLQICPGVRKSGRQGHKMGKRWRRRDVLGGGNHIIVLSDAAIKVLREMERLQTKNGTKGKYVFPKMGDSSKHMARSTINMFIKRYLSRDFPDVTIHGFRTTYKSWSLDMGHPNIDGEMTLGHSLGPMNYERDARRIEERRKMMNDWADFCGRPSLQPRIGVDHPVQGDVIPLNQTEETTDEQDRSARIA
jgi:integrase